MLQHITIKNYALIEELDIDLSSGFSVITGETGAGKSILLGAIGLLLGQRADSKSIRNGASRCVIEATFDLSRYSMQDLFEEMDIDFDGQECILRRELTSTGKSRGFINDTPATVAQLRTLGDRLIDIHSQHQNLLLAKEDFQLDVLDTLAHNEEALQTYQEAHRQYLSLQHQLKEAEERFQQSQDDEEYLRFQLTQLQEAGLEEGEQEELEEEQQKLAHAEDIKGALLQACEALSGDGESIVTQTKFAYQQVHSAGKVYAPADELAERIDSCLIELKDIFEEVSNMAEDIEYSPERLAYIDERLGLIYDLQRKHHKESVEELLQYQHELEERVASIEHGEEYLEELQQAVTKQLKVVMKQAEALSQKRQKAAKAVEQTMVDKLIPLGLPNVQFKVELLSVEHPTSTGIDRVTFLFSANKNGSLQPISQVASGGEIARVMLSLKAIISSAKSLPTIIFDEIDTGVSGQIAERMALIMREMGEQSRQVISITHLPQIASLGQHHYKVYKEDNDQETNSHIVSLTPEQRIEEIAHMLSGSTLSEAAIQNARTLLGIS